MSALANRQVVSTKNAPKAIGPYSQAIRTESMVYTAGQIGLDPSSGEIVEGGIDAQTRQALSNLKNILEAADSGLELVVKTSVFLKDMGHFEGMNSVYREYFPENPPARSTVAVAALPRDCLVEIEAVAMLEAARGD